MAATAFDHATLSKADQRMGTYLADTLSNRRDPSGARTPQHLAQAIPHHLLDDHDLIYTTAHSPRTPQSLAELPIEPVSPPGASLSPLKKSSAFEFKRRGQCAGDVGWACNIPNRNETQSYGRVDGLALVSSDLHRKHQFMRLSGDPSFDRRAGKGIQFHGSQRRPAQFNR